jgi:hypothetical protein
MKSDEKTTAETKKFTNVLPDIRKSKNTPQMSKIMIADAKRLDEG